MGGGSSDPKQQTIATSTTGPPQFPTALQPYMNLVGARATEALNYPQTQLQQYLQGQTLQVPGLSPIGQLQQQTIANRGLYGIPTPQGTQQASDLMNSPAMTQFYSLPGSVGNTPSWQAAVQGLQNEIVPQVQNAAAKAGLSQSGWMPGEIARTYAKELVPLAQQAQQTSLQATNAAAQNLQGPIASMQNQLVPQSLQEMASADQTQRNIQLAQSQAQMDAFNRNLNISLGLLNPQQQVSVTPSGSSSTTTTGMNSGGSWLFGKSILLPWLTAAVLAGGQLLG